MIGTEQDDRNQSERSRRSSQAGNAPLTCPTGVALDDRPDQRTFPICRNALRLANPTALKAEQFPYGGPKRVIDLAHLLTDLRAGTPVEYKGSIDSAITEHFGQFATKLFIRPDEQRAVLLDGVYLAGKAIFDGKESTFILDLTRYADELKPIFNLLKESKSLQLELRYVAGFHDGEKTHTTMHTVPCALGKLFSYPKTFPWEGMLVPNESPRPGTSLADLRTLKALEQNQYTFPEEVLASKIDTDLRVPSPHLKVTPFTPPKSATVEKLSDWTRKAAPDELRERWQAGARGIIDEARDRENTFCATPGGKETLQRMGEMFRDSKYLPQLPPRRINIWSDPYREHFIEALATGYETLSYLIHPDMLEGHLHASKQPFVPCFYKDIPVLSKALKNGDGVSYNEFGSWPKGYLHEDRLNESTTSALPNLWMQSILGTPTLGGLVGSSMNWKAGAHGYAAAALAGKTVFIAADGLQKSREVQALLYERTVELIKNHPVVKNYPWPEHRLSNGQKAVDYLVETAISRVGVTIKPFPAETAKENTKFFLDRYGIKKFRLYDPGITSLLMSGSEALSHAISAHIDATERLMQEGPLPSDVGYLTGQVSNMTQAAQLARFKHILAIIIGITEGGHCETGIKHGLYANNQLVLYQVARMGLPFPILADGGPGLEGAPNVLLCGGSGVLTSGALFGGVIEHPPFNHWFIDELNQLMKFTFGEAALPTKDFGNELFGSGMPKNREGISSYKILNPVYSTFSHKMLEAIFVMAKALRFEGVEHIEQLRLLCRPRIVNGSVDADKWRRPHNRERPSRALGT